MLEPKLIQSSWTTLPETNIAPKQMASQKDRIVFQPPFSGGEMLVSGRAFVPRISGCLGHEGETTILLEPSIFRDPQSTKTGVSNTGENLGSRNFLQGPCSGAGIEGWGGRSAKTERTSCGSSGVSASFRNVPVLKIQYRFFFIGFVSSFLCCFFGVNPTNNNGRYWGADVSWGFFEKVTTHWYAHTLVVMNVWGCLGVVTLPETNSSPLKIGHPKRKTVFQPSIFRCFWC